MTKKNIKKHENIYIHVKKSTIFYLFIFIFCIGLLSFPYLFYSKPVFGTLEFNLFVQVYTIIITY